MAASRALIQVAMRRPDASPDLLELGAALLSVNSAQAGLTESLLTLARSGQRLTDTEQLDLGEIVGQSVQRARPCAEDLGVELVDRLCPAPMAGDVVLLRQLSENLLHNAIQYNHDEGSVWVRVDADPGEVRLFVANTGPVLDHDEVAEAFEPFRRLDGARTTQAGAGVGLGLAISRSIVRAHGGTITAEPRAGGGMRLRVSLPRRAAPAA